MRKEKFDRDIEEAMNSMGQENAINFVINVIKGEIIDGCSLLSEYIKEDRIMTQKYFLVKDRLLKGLQYLEDEKSKKIN